MSVVKIWCDGPVGQTHIALDGRELKDVTGIQLSFPVDGLAECHVGVFLETPFELELPMDAHLHFHVPEGGRVIDVTTQSDKGTKLMVIRPEEDMSKCGSGL